MTDLLESRKASGVPTALLRTRHHDLIARTTRQLAPFPGRHGSFPLVTSLAETDAARHFSHPRDRTTVTATGEDTRRRAASNGRIRRIRPIGSAQERCRPKALLRSVL